MFSYQPSLYSPLYHSISILRFIAFPSLALFNYLMIPMVAKNEHSMKMIIKMHGVHWGQMDGWTNQECSILIFKKIVHGKRDGSNFHGVFIHVGMEYLTLVMHYTQPPQPHTREGIISHQTPHPFNAWWLHFSIRNMVKNDWWRLGNLGNLELFFNPLDPFSSSPLVDLYPLSLS
jgi:hypothetical protein